MNDNQKDEIFNNSEENNSKELNDSEFQEEGVYYIAITANINELPLLYYYEPFLFFSCYVPPSDTDSDSDSESKDEDSAAEYSNAEVIKMIKRNELDKMTVAKLKKICQVRGISSRGMKKSDIIQKIRQKIQ